MRGPLERHENSPVHCPYDFVSGGEEKGEKKRWSIVALCGTCMEANRY